MPSSFSFLGAGFSVDSASALTTALVRVVFTSTPKAFDATAADDALNPNNYTFLGPNTVTPVSVSQDGANPLAFEVVLDDAMETGTWVVTVASTLRDPFNVVISDPKTASFVVSAVNVQGPLTGGDEVTDPEPIIRRHLSRALAGPNWDGLIAALEQGDIFNRENAEAAFSQLFVSSASGPYLEQRAADQGITKPENVGISDALFRQLVIKFSTDKVVQEAIREILEVFYGQDALRAFAEADNAGPYNLSGGVFDLQWTLDETQSFTYTFQNRDFAIPGAATAREVAVALTRVMNAAQSNGFASDAVDPSTGLTKARIYSPSLGLRSAVRVTGGLAQTVLKFPESINVYRGTISPSSSYVWVYTRPTQNTTQLSLTVDTSLGTPLVDLSVVRPGDYVIITAGAATGFTGTFQVLDVHQVYSGTNFIQTLTIPQIAFTGSATQQNNGGYQFFRPVKDTIFKSDGRTVVVSQSVPRRIDISIPATTQVVNRDSTNAAYIHENAALPIQRLLRNTAGLVTLTFASPHGLSVGDQVYLDNFVPASSIPYITPEIPGLLDPQASASYASLCSVMDTPPTGNTEKGVAIQLSNGHLLFAGGDTLFALSTNANRVQDDGYTTITDGSEANGAPAFLWEWVATANMNTPARNNFAGCPLGSLGLVCGGAVAGPARTGDTQTYDPVANTWTTQGAMILPREFHSVTDLMNGSALAVGGDTSGVGTATNTTEVFNGSSWSSGPALAFPRFDHRVQRLSDGRVLVIGGRSTNGFKTNTSEIYNGSSWTRSGDMGWSRQGFGCVVLPDDRVLVFGGSGHPPCVPTDSTVSLNSCEIWNPVSGLWNGLPPMQMRRTNAFALYSQALNRVYVFAGSSSQGDDCQVVEWLDLSTMTWKHSPARTRISRGTPFGGILPSGTMVINGGLIASPLGPSLAPDVFVPGSEVISDGNLNNLFLRVSAVPDSKTIEFDGSDVPTGYSSNFGPFYQGRGPNPGAEWVIASVTRASSVTTASLTLPSGVTSDSISVGDTVYVNNLAIGFASGVFTVTAVTASGFSYADPGSNAGPDTSGGSVSQNYAPGAILRPWKQAPAVDGDIGPYIYDPNEGLAVTGGDSTTTIALAKGQHYDFVEVVNGTPFPSSGWIALGFGTANQTLPIKLLDKYTAVSGNTRLVIDYSFTMPADYPLGSEVTLLAGPSPFVPLTLDQQAGSFYLTASPAGRVAAEALVLQALAAGILENLVVVYPGDAGLGGAGLPTRGALKLSDIVEVFAGDSVSAEVLAAQEAPVL
jgi:hypothetical protein